MDWMSPYIRGCMVGAWCMLHGSLSVLDCVCHVSIHSMAQYSTVSHAITL